MGTEFIIMPKMYLELAELTEDGRTVNVDGKDYMLFKGKTFDDSEELISLWTKASMKLEKLMTLLLVLKKKLRRIHLHLKTVKPLKR